MGYQILQFKFSNLLEESVDLRNLIVKNGVILIKDVPGLKEAHAFISQFAVYKNTDRSTWAHLKKFPATVEVSNIVNPQTGKMGWFKDQELVWHTAGACMKNPEHCVGLLCSISAEKGGETEVINLRKVYNDLDEKTVQLLKKIKINYNLKLYNFGDEKADFLKHGRREQGIPLRAKRNLIYRHPVDGEYGLYFPLGIFESVADFSEVESQKLFNKLKDICFLKKYLISIKLERNDFLLMDQFHTIHRRKKFTGKRKLYRISFYWKTEKRH